MAFDEREYILRRRGWNPNELTGCRKSLEFYNPKEFRRNRTTTTDYEVLQKPEPIFNGSDEQWIKIFTVLILGIVCYMVWTIYKN